MKLENRMSLGYVKGRYWVPDTRFDAYASRPSFKRLLTAVRIAGYAFDVSYSYNAKRYMADILTHERFQNSANIYVVHHNNAYDPNPLSAAVKAITAFERCTPLIRAICLEIEVELLKDALADARRIEAAIENVCDDLAALIAKMNQPTWDEVFSDLEKTEHGSYVDRSGMKLGPVEPHLDRLNEARARPIPAAPGEDDDL